MSEYSIRRGYLTSDHSTPNPAPELTPPTQRRTFGTLEQYHQATQTAQRDEALGPIDTVNALRYAAGINRLLSEIKQQNPKDLSWYHTRIQRVWDSEDIAVENAYTTAVNLRLLVGKAKKQKLNLREALALRSAYITLVTN